MNERIPIAFLGWHEAARCLLEAWSHETSPAQLVGIVAPPGGPETLPLDISLKHLGKLSDLERITFAFCLVDLRSPGSTKPPGLPSNVTWIPSEGAHLLMRLCQGRQALRRYKEVVETATDAVVTIDESHRILFFNKAAEAIFGFSKDEVIGQDLALIIPSPHKEAHQNYVRRYVETRAGQFIDHTVELTAERRSGEEFPISISFSVTEESGHLLMTAVVRDISELKVLQEKAIQNERWASMGQALSFVTHEIKNPLVSIGGFARSLLQSSSIHENDHSRLDIIVKEVRRLEELLAEIQDFSKPLIIEKEDVCLASFLHEIMAFFRDMERSPEVTFSVDVKGDPVVHADPDRLRQVMLNLIKNAMEAIEMKGKIAITARKDGGISTIKVEDNGQGIDHNHLEIIFEPFFTTKRGGTGLGLPLCRKIIREHGGDLTIHSTIGLGTSARITLPTQPFPVNSGQ